VFGGKALCCSLPPNPDDILPIRSSLKLEKMVGCEGWVAFSVAKVWTVPGYPLVEESVWLVESLGGADTGPCW